MYNKKKWKLKREKILRRDKYLCQHYKRYGKRVDANTVHHIYPVEEYPEYAYCDWNLISLSNKAHNSMHARDNHELTEMGEMLKKRITPPTFISSHMRVKKARAPAISNRTEDYKEK